jgi:hypothetical protein
MMLRRGEGQQYQQHPGETTGVLLCVTFGAWMP